MRKSKLTSTRKLAAAIGVGQSTVRRYIRDERWPFSRSAPWRAADVRAMKDWARVTLQDDRAGETRGTVSDRHAAVNELGLERRAKLGLSLERIQSMQHARQTRQGLYHRADGCRRRRQRQVDAVAQALAAMHDDIPAEFGQGVRDWFKQKAALILRGFDDGT